MEYEEFQRTYPIELGHADEIWKDKVYTCFKKIQPHTTVLDVGSMHGCFAIYAILHGAEKVYAIEARASREYIQKCITETYGWATKIVSLHLTMSDRNATVNIANEHDRLQGQVLTYGMDFVIKTVDQIVADFRIKKVDFIKIDVEGSEIPVLVGAKETIKRDTPICAIATYHLYSYKMDGSWNTQSQLREVVRFFEETFPEYTYEVRYDRAHQNPVATFYIE